MSIGYASLGVQFGGGERLLIIPTPMNVDPTNTP